MRISSLSIGRYFFCIVFALMTAACGGGGGADVLESGATSGQPFGSGTQTPSPGNTPDTELNAAFVRFNLPAGIALAPDGDLFVVDSGNHIIRRIARSGAVTTFAGTPGVPGSIDGTGLSARFNQPHGITIGDNGDLYVTDRGNHTIRRISPQGVVTTFAGTPGIIGGVDAAGAAAQFHLPGGITSDGLGNIYVADTENYLIRRITRTGQVDTLVGMRGLKGVRNGDVANALLANPLGIAIDPAGALFVTDGYVLPPVPGAVVGATIVRKIGLDGMVSTHAGVLSTEGGNTHVDGSASSARFYLSHAVAVDGIGNLVIADTGNNAIRRVASNGNVTTLAGPEAHINTPLGIALDAAGNIYFTDSGNHVIRRLTPAGTLTIVAGTPGERGFGDSR